MAEPVTIIPYHQYKTHDLLQFNDNDKIFQ